MSLDIPDDDGRDFSDDDDDARRSATPAKHIDVWHYLKWMLFVVVLGYVLVRAHNACIAPIFDAFKEQAQILKANTVNHQNKCLDARVKASYQGYDGCLAHEEVIASGLYYPAFKLYMRKMDPCSEKGCLSIEMNALSWLTLVVPLGLGIGALLAIVILVVIVIGVQRSLSARYEMPDRMPSYAKTRWAQPQHRTTRPARKRASLDGGPPCVTIQ